MEKLEAKETRQKPGTEQGNGLEHGAEPGPGSRPEEGQGMDLWGSIKALRKKLKKTQVIPEELRIPDNIIPIERYQPDVRQGLTQAQVDERISRGLVNGAAESPSKSQKEIIYSNIFTYFNLIFFIIAILLILVGSFRDLTFLPIIVANTLIGIIQELHSKKVLDNLSILNAPKTRVVRDGKEQVLQAEDLVLDDIVIFRAGNQIPADASVEEGEILVNESLITGESDQISKKTGDMLLSGSFVVSGECRAKLQKVGKDSYVSQLTLDAKTMNDAETSEMIRSLDRLVKFVGILIIPIALILFSQQYFINEASVRDSVTATAAAIIGMIPEGLYLLASVALAVSAMRLAMQKVLVHNMKCIETLARVDVLCVDKTGTITDNTMTVKKMAPLRRWVSGGKAGAAGAGTADEVAQAGADTQQEAAARQSADSGERQNAGAQAGADAQREAAARQSADSGERQNAGAQAGTDVRRDAAVQQSADSGERQNAGAQAGADVRREAAARQNEKAAVQQETGARRSEDAQWKDGQTRESGAAVQQSPEQSGESGFAPEEAARLELMMGDFAAAMAVDNITMKAVKDYFRKRSGRRPEAVFSFSSEHKYSGAVFEHRGYVLGAPEFVLRGQYPEYEASVTRYSRQGFRVLVFAEYLGELTGQALTEPVKPLCMILLANPVRENAKQTFAYFAEQGVQIKVISGDNALTVSEVAKEAGISGAEEYVDTSVLEDDEELRAAALRYNVFGRVTPEQKRTLVSALKNAGHTVAMTGDGVNDVLALKDADCSIAMASGSDAAAQVAQLVLLESDFSKMPSVVAEGRRVVNNIERTASLFLVKNIFSLSMSILTIIFMINYPLEPSQISLISMFTIGVPAFFMALERNTDSIRGRFLSNVLLKALPGGLTDFIVISGLYLFCMEFSVNENDVSTACTIILAVVGMMVLYQIASPMTRYHWLLWFAMAAGLIYCMIFVRSIFAITSISTKCMMLLVIFAIITEPTFRYLSMGIRWLSETLSARRRK